ncbi:hypothetical protein BH09GEM1_BH09GEM1_15010 [soil metagenome]
MRPVRVDPVVEAGFAGAAQDAAMPVPFGKHAVNGLPDAVRSRRSIFGMALRIVRDAAIAVAFMAVVPIGIVALRGTALTRGGSFSEYVHRGVVKSEAYRSLALPSDPSITPAQAGRAFAEIQPGKSGMGFTAIQPQAPPAMSWRDAPITTDMFVDATPGNSHVPSTKGILQAAQKGLSPSELEFLRVLATAPAWRDFDIVAHAPAADFLGGQFRIPFAPDAHSDFRSQDYKNIREMASAAVSRAAYQMAIGQQDSAVTILRTIVSFGFSMIDNGTTTMDEVMGNQMVDIGRVALRQYYELRNDPLAQSAQLAKSPRIKSLPSTTRTADEFRVSLIAIVTDPTRPRGERFESLGVLRMSSCSNVRELVTGPRSDVTNAIADARRTLVRYPSDRALFDAMGTGAPRAPEGFSNPISDLAVSAASVAGAVVDNPRFATCTRVLTLW